MGASKAQIIELDDDYVIKIDPDRGEEQGNWLARNASPGVVRVYAIWPGGYVMERLTHGDVNIEMMIAVLAKFVWCRRPIELPNWDAIAKYAKLRAEEWWPDADRPLSEGLGYIKNRRLTHCLTHGDPTVENFMHRGDMSVLIDPLPARSYAPDLLALDLGKILQSWFGYERIRSHIRPDDPTYPDWLDVFDEEDQRAAWVFLIYHVVRLLPYQRSDRVRADIKERFGEYLFRLRPG